MVYWIVSRKPAATGGEVRFGPYESEPAARRALAELRARFLASTAGCLEIVPDFV